MADPRPLPPPGERPGPSLADRLGTWRPRVRRPAWPIPLILGAGLASTIATALLLIAAENGAAPQPARPAAPAPGPGARPEPLSTLLAAFARALPPTAHLASLDRRADGTLHAIVETTEADRLRGALAGEPSLAALRTVGEAALADGGYRVELEQRR